MKYITFLLLLTSSNICFAEKRYDEAELNDLSFYFLAHNIPLSEKVEKLIDDGWKIKSQGETIYTFKPKGKKSLIIFSGKWLEGFDWVTNETLSASLVLEGNPEVAQNLVNLWESKIE